MSAGSASRRRRPSPLFYVEGLQAASLFYISQAYGLMGANTYFAGTAEAGAAAIGRAFRAVRRGEVDVAVAGGFDDATSWWNMTKYETIGLLTDENELGVGGVPALRPRPARGRCSARARRFSCSRALTPRRRAVRRCTPSSPASAVRTTVTAC